MVEMSVLLWCREIPCWPLQGVKGLTVTTEKSASLVE